MTTIHDVAARAGVSSATVSRVLNGNATVNGDLAARVQAAIEDMQYRPSTIARSLRTQRTGVIAVVVPDIENPFFTSVVRGIEDVARANGHMTVLCNSDDLPEAERQYLTAAGDQRVDGVILASSVASADELPTSASSQFPLVMIDRRIPGLTADSVIVDDRAGARAATRHLIESGATRPACITGPRTVTTAQERLAGFLDAVEEAGIPRTDTAIRYADFDAAGGRAATDAIFAAAGVRPDGLFVGNNLMTLGALQGLGAHGMHVPDDVLFVGYDAAPWSASWSPTITSVQQPAREVGRAAMRLLIERLSEPGRPAQSVVEQPVLCVRESSVRPSG